MLDLNFVVSQFSEHHFPALSVISGHNMSTNYACKPNCSNLY